MKAIKEKALNMECRLFTKWNSFVEDRKGSDTTEKIGTILVAAVIIGLLILAVKQFMPTMFQTLMQKAQQLIQADASMPTG